MWKRWRGMNVFERFCIIISKYSCSSHLVISNIKTLLHKMQMVEGELAIGAINKKTDGKFLSYLLERVCQEAHPLTLEERGKVSFQMRVDSEEKGHRGTFQLG